MRRITSLGNRSTPSAITSCLSDGYTFAARLNILISVSSLDINSPVWELITKLNALRNAVAHRPDHKKILRILRNIRAITNKSRLFKPGDNVKGIDRIIAFAFSLAAFELDLLLAATRLRNHIYRFWEKLTPEHPLFLRTCIYLSFVNSVTTRDAFFTPREGDGLQPEHRER